LGAVERLDLALFVDRQHHCMGRGGRDRAPTMSVSLAVKLGSRERLNSAEAIMAKLNRCPVPSV
jgi:hypothetical protein